MPSVDSQPARLVEHLVPGRVFRGALELLKEPSRILAFEGGHQFDGLRHFASLELALIARYFKFGIGASRESALSGGCCPWMSVGW